MWPGKVEDASEGLMAPLGMGPSQVLFVQDPSGVQDQAGVSPAVPRSAASLDVISLGMVWSPSSSYWKIFSECDPPLPTLLDACMLSHSVISNSL